MRSMKIVFGKKRTNVAIFLLFMIPFYILAPNTFAADKPWDSGHNTVEVDKDPEKEPPKDPCPEKGSPVHIKQGNFFYSHTDLSLRGRGLVLEVIRQYDSQDLYDGPFGIGWKFNLEVRLIETTDELNEYVTIRRGDGVRLEFTRNRDGTYSPPRGRHDQVIKESDGTFTWCPSSGCTSCSECYHFDESGYLTSLEDANNSQLSFAYDSNRKLIRVTDDQGKQLAITYDTNNKISSITDIANRTFSYAYDSSGNLASFTDPLGNRTTYAYDSEHNLISVVDARGNAIEKITYDENDQVVSYTGDGEIWKYSYDAKNNIKYKDDLDGNRWTYILNNTGHLLSLTDPLGHTATNTWDDEMNRTSVTDFNGFTTTYTYNADGNKLSETDPLGNKTTYTYDRQSNKVATVTDPLGRITKYEYDATGNNTKIIRDYGGSLQSETVYEYDSKRNQTSVTDPLGNTTSFAYDTKGNITQITDPLGNKTTYTYDIRGNMLTETDSNGSTTAYAYDLMDRITTVTDAIGSITTHAYDANGNQVSVTDADGNITTFTYDVLNRITQETDPLGNTTSYTYGWRDKKTSVTDANGNTNTYTFDILDRIAMTTDALGGKTTYTYDAEGNVLSVTDANGNTITNVYDHINRPIQTTYPDSTTESFAYNAVGYMTSKTTRNGDTINYIYDSLDRLVKKSFPDGTSVSYLFNSNSNVLSVSNTNVTYLFTYDALNRITQVQNSTLGKTISYSYHMNEIKDSMTNGEGEVTKYEYNGIHLLEKIIGPSGGVTSYHYDRLGRVKEKVLPNGIRASYSYDSIGRLKGLENKNSSVVSKFNYTYDNSANRISMTTLGGTHKYAYDKNNQITQSTHTSLDTETYTYDKVGNRLTSTSDSNWVYGTMNRLKSFNDTSFTYDGNGNTIIKTDSKGQNSYVWDYENRLVQVTLPAGDIIKFSYDPFGNRVSKSVNGLIVYYLYDGEDIIAEYDSKGIMIAKYTHGKGIDEPISTERRGRSYFYTFDGLGSVSELTDSHGSVVQSYTYDSFGSILEQVGTIDNPYTFTGREYDKESALFYFRARYYNATIGRFLSSDPVRFQGGINFYLYSNNNPVNYIDPTGLKKCVTYGDKAPIDIATIVCDGAGSIKVKLGWCEKKSKCLQACCKVHEATHKNDCLGVSPNVCKGKAVNTRVYMEPDSFLKKSECDSYKADLKCSKSKLKTKECCGDKDLERDIKKVEEKRLKTFCK